MSKHSRRAFLQTAVGAAAAATTISLPKFARAARTDVNSKIRMAVVGFNGRGKAHIEGFSDEIVALCDVDAGVLGKGAAAFEKKYGRKVDQISDFRKLLDRKDIDAISIATPNHTHSYIGILACLAGKDVYSEKPISHGVWEGRQFVKHAEKYNRIVQCGTQARSHKSLRDAVAYVHSGELGKIKYVTGTCYKPRRSIGKLNKPLMIPTEIDYDMWCGPAAKVDLYRPNLHYDWHWDYNTGNGDMGNQGIHQMDISRWFLGETTLSPRILSFGGRFGYDDAGNTANTQVVLHDYEKAPLIFETRGLPKNKASQKDANTWEHSMDDFHGARVGVVVHCEHGRVVSAGYDTTRVYDNDGQNIKTFKGGGNHFQNFLDAVKSRKRSDLHADVLEGHLSSGLCHTGGVSHQLGEPHTAKDILKSVEKNENLHESLERMFAHLNANEVDVDKPVVVVGAELKMDPVAEKVTNNSAGNDMMRRVDRKPFITPEIA